MFLNSYFSWFDSFPRTLRSFLNLIRRSTVVRSRSGNSGRTIGSVTMTVTSNTSTFRTRNEYGGRICSSPMRSKDTSTISSCRMFCYDYILTERFCTVLGRTRFFAKQFVLLTTFNLSYYLVPRRNLHELQRNAIAKLLKI